MLAAGGDEGAYVREVPPSYSGRTPLPVVIDLHGWGEQAVFQVQITKLGDYGAAHRFITITPQVTEPALVWRLDSSGKDVVFMGALLDTVEKTLCVDTNRIYVTGYSYGAFLTSTLACVYARRIAAVAPVAGIQNPAGCHPSRPVPVVAFHGTADPFVPYLGGIGSASLKLPAPDGSHRTLGQALGKKASKFKGPTIPDNTAAWAKRNGCAPRPTERTVATRVTLITYSCPRATRWSSTASRRVDTPGPAALCPKQSHPSWATPPWRSRPTRSCGPSSWRTRSGAEGSAVETGPPGRQCGQTFGRDLGMTSFAYRIVTR